MKASLVQSNALKIPLADTSVQLSVTSPPYYALRNYGMAGQIGQEATPDEYIYSLSLVFEEVRRVLKDDGIMFVNIGDSYAGSGGPGSQYDNRAAPKYKREFVKYKNPNRKVAGIKNKDLIGIPWMLAFALRDNGWWLRNDNIWWKPNAMPEGATGDRFHRDHEYVFMFSKSAKYYFNQDAVRVAYDEPIDRWGGEHRRNPKNEKYSQLDGTNAQGLARKRNVRPDARGRNHRTVWKMNTSSYPGAHSATFPTALPELCIKAGSREGDKIIDPFGGSGTTAAVAKKLGRIGICLDLSWEYLQLAKKRCGKVEYQYSF